MGFAVVWGERLYGRVDKVPGFFCIATRFGHLNYVPVFPVSSHIIFLEQGGYFRSVPIPLNAKSILVVYGRVLIGVLWPVLAIYAYGMTTLPGDKSDAAGMAAIVGVLFFAWLALLIAPAYRKPSYRRACQLEFLANLTDVEWESLNQKYGRSGNLPLP